MKLEIRSSSILVEGSKDQLTALHESYSYRDLAIEYQLKRLEKSAFYSKQFGSWANSFESLEDFENWVLTKTKELLTKLHVFACEFEGEHLIVPIGLLQRLRSDLAGTSVNFETTDTREFLLPRRHMVGNCHPLRFPQQKALALLKQTPVGMLRMATGVGKTTVGQEIIRHYGVKSLFLVPSRPILHQTVRSFRAAFGSRNVGIYGDGKQRHSHVTVATYQSVYAADSYEFEEYDLVIADEAHHTPAETYYAVVETKLKNAVYRYGLTADEERSDGGTILVEAATGPVVYSYEAPEAIRDGFLAQPTFIVYEVTRTEGTHIRWKTVKKERLQDGINQSEAYDGDDAHRAYKNWILGNDSLNRAISDLVIGLVQNGSNVLILIDEREQGDKLMEFLKPHGAEMITGDTKGNTEVLARFNARALKPLIATSTLSEGADTVTTDVLVNLLGGMKTKQANGRALRNDPDENGIPRKPTCLIIDFDVPASPVLHRHFESRLKIHETCGPVYRRPLI